MGRYTLTYIDFIDRLDEVSLLRRKAGQLERSRQSNLHGAEISALCRGAVVLLSGHVEAYVKELGEHTLDTLYVRSVQRSLFAPQFFYHISKESLESVRSATQPEKIAEHVQAFVSEHAVFWSKSGGLPNRISSKDFNGGFSNPTFDKVKAYLGRFGYSDFRRDYMRRLGGSANTSIASLDHIVETRNSIAHGDPSATKTPTEVKAMESTARNFCRTTDDLFSSWCKSNFCSIRS